MALAAASARADHRGVRRVRGGLRRDRLHRAGVRVPARSRHDRIAPDRLGLGAASGARAFGRRDRRGGERPHVDLGHAHGARRPCPRDGRARRGRDRRRELCERRRRPHAQHPAPRPPRRRRRDRAADRRRRRLHEAPGRGAPGRRRAHRGALARLLCPHARKRRCRGPVAVAGRPGRSARVPARRSPTMSAGSDRSRCAACGRCTTPPRSTSATTDPAPAQP